ncbi:MAG: methylmalonyl-CoA epimerase [Bacteriovoracaceae bacterium]
MLKDCQLDHIAIAVKNIEEKVKIYRDLGIHFEDRREIVPEQKVKTAFATIEEHAHLELLEPTSDQSPIAQYIAKKGEGIHHLCFKVTDIKAKSAELKAKGYTLIYENPVKGANNKLINFIHPKSTGGVLIELSEELG